MKKIFLLAVTACFLLFNAKAQENTSRRLLLIHTIYLNVTAENMNVNLDSLLTLYKQYLFDMNPYYLNTKIVKHLYGHDSREVLMISEVKNWDDLEKADAKRTDLIQKMPASMAQAGRLWFSFNSPEHHSDEIYQVVVE